MGWWTRMRCLQSGGIVAACLGILSDARQRLGRCGPLFVGEREGGTTVTSRAMWAGV